MPPRSLSVSDATRGKVIVPSTFSGYDCCLNAYVGCQFGCAYCYVRFFVKDPGNEWGEFVRLRRHVVDRLPNELGRWEGRRLVMGTMTDPYQPVERSYRLTRSAIRIINESPFKLNKVGIFTRSPIVLDDLDDISKLPRARVHFTITPYSTDVITKLEPIAIRTNARFKAVRKIKEAGIRVHVNVAPAIPIVSTHEQVIEFADQLASIGVDEFFVDPMQTYTSSFDATFRALHDHPFWTEIAAILQNKRQFAQWKDLYRGWWFDAWSKHKDKPILPIWSDHVNHTWTDMRTGQTMSRRSYGDDIAPIQGVKDAQVDGSARVE